MWPAVADVLFFSHCVKQCHVCEPKRTGHPPTHPVQAKINLRTRMIDARRVTNQGCDGSSDAPSALRFNASDNSTTPQRRTCFWGAKIARASVSVAGRATRFLGRFWRINKPRHIFLRTRHNRTNKDDYKKSRA